MSTLVLFSVLILPGDPVEIARLAAGLRQRGELDFASTLYQYCARRTEAASGPESTQTLTAWHNAAVVLVERGEHVRAIPLLRRVIQKMTKLSEPAEAALDAANLTLAIAYTRDGEFRASAALLDRLESGASASRPIVCAARGEWLLRQARHAAAQELLQSCLRGTAQNDDARLAVLQLSAVAEFSTGDLRMASVRISEALALAEALWGVDSASLLYLLEAQKRIADKLGRRSEAQKVNARIRSLRSRTIRP